MTLLSLGAWRWMSALPCDRLLYPRTSSLLSSRTRSALDGEPLSLHPPILGQDTFQGSDIPLPGSNFLAVGNAPIPGVCPLGNLATGISELGYPNACPGHTAAPGEVLFRLLVTNTREAKLQKGDKGGYMQAQVASLGTDPK